MDYWNFAEVMQYIAYGGFVFGNLSALIRWGSRRVKFLQRDVVGEDGKLYDLTKALPEFNVKFSAINGTLSDYLAKVINYVACVNYSISDYDTISVESGDVIFII